MKLGPPGRVLRLIFRQHELVALLGCARFVVRLELDVAVHAGLALLGTRPEQTERVVAFALEQLEDDVRETPPRLRAAYCAGCNKKGVATSLFFL